MNGRPLGQIEVVIGPAAGSAPDRDAKRPTTARWIGARSFRRFWPSTTKTV